MAGLNHIVQNAVDLVTGQAIFNLVKLGLEQSQTGLINDKLGVSMGTMVNNKTLMSGLSFELSNLGNSLNR